MFSLKSSSTTWQSHEDKMTIHQYGAGGALSSTRDVMRYGGRIPVKNVKVQLPIFSQQREFCLHRQWCWLQVDSCRCYVWLGSSWSYPTYSETTSVISQVESRRFLRMVRDILPRGGNSMPLQSALHPRLGRYYSHAPRSCYTYTSRSNQGCFGIEVVDTCYVYNDLDQYICGQGFVLGAFLELGPKHV